MNNKKKYITVALGGTFDHFHDGHKAFIDAAAGMGQRLIIGIATNKLIHNKPYRFTIEPLKKRFRSVGNYCKSQGYSVELIELNDIYGPTVDPDVKIDALFVTTETQAGADKIVTIREQLSLGKLAVHVVNLLPAEDGKPIHAARIRAGEISRTGTVYRSVISKDITLSEKQRQEFSKLQGKLVTDPSSIPSVKIVVGDSTLEQFLSFNYDFHVGIFDGFCEREVYSSQIIDRVPVDYTTQNPAGSLNSRAVVTLSEALNQEEQTFIKVEGEEDLLAVAAVLLAPLGSFVYYGQPQKGMVEIEVTERIKDHFYHVLNQ